uniref:Uncharacterized protein n=1 Tax=Trichogramma kaykai TaxID=54128 RepID=A0ABD2WYH4_9HYME
MVRKNRVALLAVEERDSTGNNRGAALTQHIIKESRRAGAGAGTGAEAAAAVAEAAAAAVEKWAELNWEKQRGSLLQRTAENWPSRNCGNYLRHAMLPRIVEQQAPLCRPRVSLRCHCYTAPVILIRNKSNVTVSTLTSHRLRNKVLNY